MAVRLGGQLVEVARPLQRDVDDGLDVGRLVTQDDDAVREKDRLVDLRRDEQRRHPRLFEQRGIVFLHQAARHVVETPEGLVQDHDLRVVDEGSRDLGASLHPPRDLLRELVLESGESHLREQARRLLGDFLLSPALLDRTEHDVLQQRHPRKQRRLLEHHGAVTARSPDGAAVDCDLAHRRLLVAGDQLDQRALAASGRPEEHGQLAGRDVERTLAQDDLVLARPLIHLTDVPQADRAGGANSLRRHVRPSDGMRHVSSALHGNPIRRSTARRPCPEPSRELPLARHEGLDGLFVHGFDRDFLQPQELRRREDLGRPRPRQVDVDGLLDVPRPGGHDEHTIG